MEVQGGLGSAELDGGASFLEFAPCSTSKGGCPPTPSTRPSTSVVYKAVH
jgi:hypothetical protein